VSVVDGANVDAVVPTPAGRGGRVRADRPDPVADSVGRVVVRALAMAGLLVTGFAVSSVGNLLTGLLDATSAPTTFIIAGAAGTAVTALVAATLPRALRSGHDEDRAQHTR
jgi:hypothetical protein